jgi:hypothetical protein
MHLLRRGALPVDVEDDRLRVVAHLLQLADARDELARVEQPRAQLPVT